MKKVVKIFFVRDNYDADYDVIEDCYSAFCMAATKEIPGISGFNIAEENGRLIIKEPEGSEIHIRERQFCGNYSGEEMLNLLRGDVVDYGRLLDEFGLMKEHFDTRILIVKDFADPDVDKAFDKIIGHYLDRDDKSCKPFCITSFKRLHTMFCLPIMFPAFDLGQKICEDYGLDPENEDAFGPYRRWSNLAWSILNGYREGVFLEFMSKNKPDFMLEIFGILLATATALFTVEPKARRARV